MLDFEELLYYIYMDEQEHLQENTVVGIEEATTRENEPPQKNSSD